MLQTLAQGSAVRTIQRAISGGAIAHRGVHHGPSRPPTHCLAVAFGGAVISSDCVRRAALQMPCAQCVEMFT